MCDMTHSYVWHDSFTHILTVCRRGGISAHMCVCLRVQHVYSRQLCAGVLQCVAMCCSVLQCAAVCCSVLQCAAVCCSVLQCAAVCCSVLQCVAVCCSVLQCAAVCCSVLQCAAVCCSVLQCAVVCCTHPSAQDCFTKVRAMYCSALYCVVQWTTADFPVPYTDCNAAATRWDSTELQCVAVCVGCQKVCCIPPHNSVCIFSHPTRLFCGSIALQCVEVCIGYQKVCCIPLHNTVRIFSHPTRLSRAARPRALHVWQRCMRSARTRRARTRSGRWREEGSKACRYLRHRPWALILGTRMLSCVRKFT